MEVQTTYTVLLSREYQVSWREYPLYGFSYEIWKDQTGEVKIREIGQREVIELYGQDGPELADLTEEQVKERIEEVLNA
jgi:hypothetical protein